jgi:hypothetical protein
VIDGISILGLAKKTGADRATVRKWLDIEGVKPLVRKAKKKLYNEKEALAALKPHLLPKGSRSTQPNIDPKTGLTWNQKLLKEKAREVEMENDRKAKLLSDEIMLTTDHHRILAAVISRVEQVPGKAQSELGLNGAQVLGLRRMLDEARVTSAKEIAEMD